MRSFLAEFADPCGIGLGETIAELFELTVTHLDIPGGFNGAPALLKLGAVGLGEAGFGVALHVNRAELDVGVGEEALTNGQQTGEVVLNKDHDPSKPTLDQATENGLPIFKILAAWLGNTAQNSFFAIAA